MADHPKEYFDHRSSGNKQRDVKCEEVLSFEMENFILYEKLGSGDSSEVYKGRRKGCLNYSAIVCSDKIKRPEITNHVRLSHDLEHPNIVSFHEWYETSNHLWLVVELCTGGSLESVIVQDGYLSEDVVRNFGWGLVQGLNYIHEMGVIFSDMTPAKILLDGSGVLKFGNFCHSKAQGETLEDFFSLLSTSEMSEQGDASEQFDRIRTKLEGSLFYKAPDVLLGSETNVSTDLWALGCVLYYMYTGKPPFYSDSNAELTEMILQQEPPPPRQVASGSSPSEDFSNLLKGLLNKDSSKRMNWSELMHHSFWSQAREKEGTNSEEEEVENDEEDNAVEEDIDDSEAECSASERIYITDSLCSEVQTSSSVNLLLRPRDSRNIMQHSANIYQCDENTNSQKNRHSQTQWQCHVTTKRSWCQ